MNDYLLSLILFLNILSFSCSHKRCLKKIISKVYKLYRDKNFTTIKILHVIKMLKCVKTRKMRIKVLKQIETK